MNNKTFILLFFICIVLLAAIFVPEENLKETSILANDSIIRRVEHEPNKIAFACNVDWGSECIPDMLSLFKEEDITITFFPTGNWAKKNAKLLREMYIYGHEIGNHGYSHKLAKQIDRKEEENEIMETEKIINELIGEKINLYAPPSGDFDETTLDICRELGYHMILWSIDTIDWRSDSTAEKITERVIKKPLKGGIVLMHPKEETVKALPEIIRYIKEKGIQIVSVGELISQ